MTEADYRRLGLRSGLEIHQQLLTEKKLFCRCPAGHYSNEYDAEILRHMRPTLSELGEYDGTALMEFKTKKEIIYRINHDTVCTYEMDDTPPFEINQQALDIALQLGQLMNFKMVGEIHIARKQYLDGSIPTGFQRTTIVGVDGWIPYRDRKIGLIQLGLEEDACREISDIGHQRIYITDRLGMPLIETVTRPEMYTPQQVAEVANILRWLVRSTGKVRTGIGAARQDVNVSITGGTRIEIKGVPRIPMIPKLIYNEAMRQYALLRIKDELNKRGIDSKSFKAFDQDVTALITGTTWEPIERAIRRGDKVRCVNLKGFAGILSHPTQSGKTFSKEISDRVRVIACLTRLPNILTSENPEETVDSFMWHKIRKKVHADVRDALILVWGNEQDLDTAVSEIIIRAREATEGVPRETRQALPDSTNGFERILPGADRMYPDTDLPPLEITPRRLKKLDEENPPPLWEREKRYRKMGLPEHLIIPIASSPGAKFFEKIVDELHAPPLKVARYLFESTKHWQRRGYTLSGLNEDKWRFFFEKAVLHPPLWQVGEELIEEYLQQASNRFETLFQPYLTSSFKKDELEKEIDQIFNAPIKGSIATEKKERYMMGLAMKKFKGYVLAGEILELIRKRLNKEVTVHE